VMRSTYLGDPGEHRHHLIFISSCYTTYIHTLSFLTFGLNVSFRDLVTQCNCEDSHGQVVSSLPTSFLSASSYNLFASRALFGHCERCGGILMVGCLPSSSVVSPLRPPSGASPGSLNGCLQVLLRLCSTTICDQIDYIYI
jgi:hypothetical protein